MASAPLLELRGVTKRFTATPALADVDFDLHAGELHALLGENGAGKSTLIKLLAGIHTADRGEFRVRGRTVDPRTDVLPVAFIHQDLGLVDAMTVAENVALVAGYDRHRGLIAWGRQQRRTAELLSLMGSDIDAHAAVGSLSAAERAIVAIVRALANRADVIVLDEPTAALQERDVARLFAVLRRLKSEGKGIIYVTHRLDEVFAIGDRVTVLRDGRKVQTTTVAKTTPGELVFKIVGRRLSELFVRPAAPRREVLAQVRDLRCGGVGPVDFEVHQGEILGLVGLRGSGHDVVGRVLCGDRPAEGGTAMLDGRPALKSSTRGAAQAGIGFVSSKRAEESLATGMTVRENLFINPELIGHASNHPIAPGSERRRADELLRRFDVRPAATEEIVNRLSGGNQQKVVLARWLQTASRLLILEEPTVGVDVGAKAQIYGMLARSLASGGGVLLISSDFEEVAGISHRALVFNRGRLVGELHQHQLSVERLTALASGASPRTDDAEGRRLLAAPSR
jgi:ribose transport system ATP-binding protein